MRTLAQEQLSCVLNVVRKKKKKEILRSEEQAGVRSGISTEMLPPSMLRGQSMGKPRKILLGFSSAMFVKHPEFSGKSHMAITADFIPYF